MSDDELDAEAMAVEDAMLRHHELRPGAFNEVVIDPGTWSADTVDAFYFIRNQMHDGEAAARKVHNSFHARHPHAAVPLLHIELASLARPFTRVA